MKFSLALSLLLWTLVHTDVQLTGDNTVSESRVLHLEQTVLDLQSTLQVQDQKYSAVLSSVLSKLSSTTDELENVKHEFDEMKMNASASEELVKSELRILTSDYWTLQSEYLDLKLKMKEQENKTMLLESDLRTCETNLQTVVSTEVIKLSTNITFSINSVQSNVTSVASEQDKLSAKVDNIINYVSQLKAGDNNDSTCSMESSGCPLGFISHGSSCYLFSRNTATFPQAHSICQFLSSHLAVITSSEEENFIREHLNMLKEDNYLIGGSDLSHEGTWTWGCPLKSMPYTNWAPGEPDNFHGIENCLTLYKKLDYQWVDQTCDSKFHYICERKAHW